MTTSPTPDRADAKRTTGRKPSSRRNPHRFQGGTSEANRIAVAILEVLAGARSPAEAADALKTSLPRYYILETRALEGMVAACEPKPLGKQPSPETRIASLEKELQQSRRECARQQALVRAAQRSVGLSATETQKGKTSSKRDRRGRKKRRPVVRALKAADTLKSRIASAEVSAVQQTAPSELAAAPVKVNFKEDQGEFLVEHERTLLWPIRTLLEGWKEMAGRKPTGPPLVHHLDGSKRAKERLKTILETVAEKIAIREACDRLGIEEAMFFRLRTQALQAGLARLEPRPSGRPPRRASPEDQRIAKLEQELQEKNAELKAMAVRLEIAQAMPELARDEALKKTIKPKQRRKQLAKRKRRRRK